MRGKGSWAIILLILFPLGIAAQDTEVGLNVQTNPPGAEVSLIGTISVTGLSPVNFSMGLEGNYRVRIKKYGYETYRSSVFIQPGRAVNLTVNLRSKTRLKAAARSLFIPGWGQYYTEQKSKGFLYAVGAVGAVASYLITNSDFNNKNDEYLSALSRYDDATTYSEKERLYPQVQSAKRSAYRAETKRRIAIGATVAVWSLNVLDVLLFFPESGGSMIVSGIEVKPRIDSGGTSISLAYRF